MTPRQTSGRSWLALLTLAANLVIGGCDEDVFSLASTPKAEAQAIQPCSGTIGSTWYVRTDGGDANQCTGLTDAPAPNNGELGQDCAFKHPFYVLPPGGDPLLGPGDRLIIASGEYRMGAGAPGTEGLDLCTTDHSSNCVAPPIPSGADEGIPTCILGAGWNDGCNQRPVLKAGGLVDHVLSLEHSDHVHIECLEITDESPCVEGVDSVLPCQESPPDHDAGYNGIVASDSNDIMLKNLLIYGLAANGIIGEGSSNWKLEDLDIHHNGHSGISFSDGETTGVSTYDEFALTGITASWNGCNWPIDSSEPSCYDNENGFGLNGGLSAANWHIENCDFSHNTTSGLRIHRDALDNWIHIDRLRAEGNAGVQAEIGGAATIVNSLVLSNCEFPFNGEVEPCKSDGYALLLSPTEGSELNLVNSTIFGQGAALIGGADGEEGCPEWELTLLNNIFYGSSGEWGLPVFRELPCPGQMDLRHNIIVNTADGVEPCYEGEENECEDPNLFESAPDPLNDNLFNNLTPTVNSEAIDKGLSWEDHHLVPNYDYDNYPRPFGDGVDCGAYEIQQ